MTEIEAHLRADVIDCPEVRLEQLRAALLRPILTVQSVAALLTQLGPRLAEAAPEIIRPDEYHHLIDWLNEAGRDLRDIREALGSLCPEQ